MSRELPTLAEELRAAGYRTGAFVANFSALAPDLGFARGFDEYSFAPRTVAIVRPALGSLLSLAMPARYAAFVRPYRSATEINAAAIDWLEAERGGPRFLFLNYMEAHNPYQPPPPFHGMYGGLPGVRDDCLVPWTWLAATREDMYRTDSELSPRMRAHFIDSYDASIRYLDDQLGELFTRFEQRGTFDNSLVAVTADHGELFGEHDLIEHSCDPYEGVTHVPLLVRYPGEGRGRRVAETIETRKIFDLVMGTAAGADTAGPWPESAQDLPVVSETYLDPRRSSWTARFDRSRRAVYAEGWKLIFSSDGEHELYDLNSDPRETMNLYDPLMDRCARLTEQLESWLRSAETSPLRVELDDVGEDTVEWMRALGYVR